MKKFVLHSESNITNIILPSTINSIGQRVFENCKELSRIEIPETVTSMEDSVFAGWTPEQTIKVPFKEGEPAPNGWDKYWDSGCGAKIEYAQ